jgi:hypothetical protein
MTTRRSWHTPATVSQERLVQSGLKATGRPHGVPRDPDRLYPLCREAGLVRDQHAALVAEMLNHVCPQVIASTVQQALLTARLRSAH